MKKKYKKKDQPNKIPVKSGDEATSISENKGNLIEEVLENSNSESLAMAKANWFFGEWEELVKLDIKILENHPDTSIFSALIAAAYQQLGDFENSQAHFILALELGCDQEIIFQLLITGVHNSLGGIAALNNDDSKSLYHFNKAIEIDNQASAPKFARHSRCVKEMIRLGLLSQATKLLGEESLTLKSFKGRPSEIDKRIDIFRNELKLVNYKLSLNDNMKATSIKKNITSSIGVDESLLSTQTPDEEYRKFEIDESSFVNLLYFDDKKIEEIMEAGIKNTNGEDEIVVKKRYKKKKSEFDFIYRLNSLGDLGVIKQMFVNDDYYFSHFKQAGYLEVFLKNIRNNNLCPLIIDAGANIGSSCIHFNLHYKDAIILAIEPDHNNCLLLSCNCAGLPVYLFEGALSSDKKMLNLYDPGHSDWGFRTTDLRKEGALSTPPITPDELLSFSETIGGAPFIVKIDIEGGEGLLFSTNTKWLTIFPLIIIELHDWMLPFEGTSNPFLQVIANSEFDFLYKGENIFCFNRSLLKELSLEL